MRILELKLKRLRNEKEVKNVLDDVRDNSCLRNIITNEDEQIRV